MNCFGTEPLELVARGDFLKYDEFGARSQDEEEPQVEGGKQEVPRKEVRPQPLEYLVGTVGRPIILRIIVGERQENIYGVVVPSTNLQLAPVGHT